MRARLRVPLHRLLLSAATLVALILCGAAPALGSTWTGRQLPGEAATVMMFGISCPTPSLCVAVGGNNTIAASTDPAGGSASWSVTYAGEGAVSTGPRAFFAGRQVRGVSCPSPQLCVAVTFDGFIYVSTNPTGGADAWSVTDLAGGGGPNTHLYGVSCPSPSFCAASAGQGRIITSTNPMGGAAAWATTQLATPLELRGISCASPALCVAVGDNGDDARPADSNNGEIVVSANPLSGAWQRVEMPAAGSLFGASCPSPALCVTGNRFGSLLTSSSPIGAPSAWASTAGGGTVQLTGFDCLSPSQCIAVDDNGDVLTSTNPTGGPGAWTFANVLPYPQLDETVANHMTGISCPSASFCAVSVNQGQILTSEDPFAQSPLPVKKKNQKKHKKRHGKGPRRPRTHIGRQPFPTVELDSRKLTVRFGFYARHHVPVRGFACKIDRRPMKRCHSPKAYRVGAGRHHFRVRAIGWSGLKGPPETAWFRACRPPSPPPPMPLPPCWRHSPAS
jgi:hypothetical protein